MKKIGFVLVTIFMALSMMSCVRNSSDPRDNNVSHVTSKRVVKYFCKMEIHAFCNVHYVQGDVPSVKITGPAKLVKSIVTECDGVTLNIRQSKNNNWFNFGNPNMDDVDVYVNSPDLISVAMYGSGDFSADGKIDSDNFEISLSGSGDVDLADVICDKMTTTLKGSGDIDIQHLQCGESSILLAGAGNIDVNQYNVAKSDIVLRGVGDINVDLDKCGSVACQLYGVGNISLNGSAKHFEKSVMGTGEIDSDNLKVGK